MPDGYVTFERFLTEIFNTESIQFGINYPDLNDRQFQKYILKNKIEVRYTFFKIKERYYCVSIGANGEISFSVSKIFSTKISDYSYKELKVYNALKVFNAVITIVLYFVKKFNMKIIIFAGATPNLEDMYSKMLKNPSFLRLLDDNGFELYKDGNENTHRVKAGLKRKKLFVFRKKNSS